MLTRITADIENTEELVGAILVALDCEDARAGFLVPAGNARFVLARIRVKISRSRQKLLGRNKKPKRFTLRSSVHPETHGGIRYDCVICWKTTDESDFMLETLEDLLAQ